MRQQEQRRKNLASQISALDANQPLVLILGGQKGLDAFSAMRAELVALLEGGAEAPAADGEWDGRCRFVMTTK